VSFRVLLHPAVKFLEKLDAPTAARIKEPEAPWGSAPNRASA
jgi:hypothetical protein